MTVNLQIDEALIQEALALSNQQNERISVNLLD